MNRIIAAIVALPLLVASMPKQASALSVIGNPDVQKPQAPTLLARQMQRHRWIRGHWIIRNHHRVWIRGHNQYY
ncbi:hypothetical protein [Nostoc sp.]|uniref:hypothetical protein n=1 Tax=Nostoc sp. TaxID=1180 RepID=UPI002FFD2FB3